MHEKFALSGKNETFSSPPVLGVASSEDPPPDPPLPPQPARTASPARATAAMAFRCGAGRRGVGACS